MLFVSVSSSASVRLATGFAPVREAAAPLASDDPALCSGAARFLRAGEAYGEFWLATLSGTDRVGEPGAGLGTGIDTVPCEPEVSEAAPIVSVPCMLLPKDKANAAKCHDSATCQRLRVTDYLTLRLSEISLSPAEPSNPRNRFYIASSRYRNLKGPVEQNICIFKLNPEDSHHFMAKIVFFAGC